MKRRIFVLVVLMTLLSVFAWARGSSQQEKVVAGVVNLEDQYMRFLSMGYQDAAQEAGVRVLLSNTNGDIAREAELINTYVSQNVAGLVIVPANQTSSIAMLQRASQTMKIAIVGWPLDNAPFIVGGYASNNVNLGASSGEAAAEFIRTQLGGRAKIALIRFHSFAAEPSNDRVNGFIEAVRKVNPNVEVVAEQDAWVQDAAVQVVGDILTANRDINIIFAANDGGTIGSVMAVMNAGLAGRVFVYGIDTGEQQIAMLRNPDNILQAVTGQDPYGQGYNGMKLVIDAINGKDYSATQGKIATSPGLLLNRSNPAGIDAFERDLRARLSR
jgi:simple sugar transport system substrate-binding protein/ribose transport system substrate-binding protein